MRYRYEPAKTCRASAWPAATPAKSYTSAFECTPSCIHVPHVRVFHRVLRQNSSCSISARVFRLREHQAAPRPARRVLYSCATAGSARRSGASARADDALRFRFRCPLRPSRLTARSLRQILHAYAQSSSPMKCPAKASSHPASDGDLTTPPRTTPRNIPPFAACPRQREQPQARQCRSDAGIRKKRDGEHGEPHVRELDQKKTRRRRGALQRSEG